MPAAKPNIWHKAGPSHHNSDVLIEIGIAERFQTDFFTLRQDRAQLFWSDRPRKRLRTDNSSFFARWPLLSRRLPPLLLGLFCFAIYNANFRQIGAGDKVPARYLPLLLWKYGTFELGQHAALVAAGHPRSPNRDRPAGAEGKVSYYESWTYWFVATDDHQLASLYPVVAPLLVTPLYLPAILWLDHHGWEQPNLDRVAEIMEKLSASLIATLACVTMYFLLCREAGGWTIPLTLAFAFGTNTWMISSQALWQHGMGQLFVALGLLLVFGLPSPRRLALLGAICVLMAANRPPDALIAAALIIGTLWQQPAYARWLFAGALLPLTALVAYNVGFVGFVAGGYGAARNPASTFFHLNGTGLLGLLFSPARGLLFFRHSMRFCYRAPWSASGLRTRGGLPGS